MAAPRVRSFDCSVLAPPVLDFVGLGAELSGFEPPDAGSDLETFSFGLEGDDCCSLDSFGADLAVFCSPLRATGFELDLGSPLLVEFESERACDPPVAFWLWAWLFCACPLDC